MGLFRSNPARRAAKAEAKVAKLTEESMRLQVQRSKADAEVARQAAEKLRAEKAALEARFTALERGVKI